jgi:hypothetical protein
MCYPILCDQGDSRKGQHLKLAGEWGWLLFQETPWRRAWGGCKLCAGVQQTANAAPCCFGDCALVDNTRQHTRLWQTPHDDPQHRNLNFTALGLQCVC